MMRYVLLLLLLLPASWLRAQQVSSDSAAFASFVEPDFPFITTTVDARDLAPALPEGNVAVRGIVVQLGNDAYACFDPDLLRMAAAWTGDFLSLMTMAQVSYHESGNKGNDIPRILGRPVFGTGLYPGWGGGTPQFTDPRPVGPNPEEAGRGPLPASMGHWKGLYLSGDRVVFAYTARGTDIYEQPSSVAAGGDVGVARTFEVGPGAEALSMVAAESGTVVATRVQQGRALLYQGPAQDTVTAVGLLDAPEGARLHVEQDRYVTLHLPPRTASTTFSIVLWRGPAGRLDAFDEMLRQPLSIGPFRQGGLARWLETVATRADVAPDTAALVVDRIARPLPNPWRRGVRVADVDFFDEDRAALATFEGDVWLVSGFGGDLQHLTWRRFASGLYEPMSISLREGAVYVFGREGIVRLHDLNGDDEADFYENFSNLAVQSSESREFPLSMVKKPGGGFYLAKGAALDMGPRTSAATMPGFRAGAPHSGTVLEVSPDGRSVRMVAGGLREPYLGVHPGTGLLTASDQQGNFVPTTPLFVIREGGYYGVPATAHRDPVPDPAPPLVWVPHEVDPSGAEQVWITDGQMGPLNGRLLHLSYGRPTAYLVLVDSLGEAVQGGILTLPVRFPGPVMKGRVHPGDGQLYLTGFQVWGSQAEEVSGFYRLRYTGRPLILPTALKAGPEGILVRFNAPLDPGASTQVGNFEVRRWNYERSERYGSGHFRLDGTAGQEVLPVAEVQRSRDGEAVLVVVPGMQEVMQMALAYRLKGTDGTEAVNTLYLTVNELEALELEKEGFEPVRAVAAQASASQAVTAAAEPAVEATAELGHHLYLEMGCMACHSTDGTLAGKVGPSFKGLYGSMRTFTDGSTRKADAAYLRQSILAPSAEIVEGFEEGMPVYEGVLSETQVEALVLFIQSLSE